MPMILHNYEILLLTRELMIEIHRLTVQLSAMQMFENRQHLPGSVFSVTSAIAEGCTRKQYSYEFIKHLVSAQTFGNSTDHLETLFEKGSLNKENLCAALKNKLEILGNMINGLNQSADVARPDTN